MLPGLGEDLDQDRNSPAVDVGVGVDFQQDLAGSLGTGKRVKSALDSCSNFRITNQVELQCTKRYSIWQVFLKLVRFRKSDQKFAAA